MPLSLQAVGQVQSEHSVQIRPQVSGMLEAVYFSEGQAVTKGQRLFRIDPAPYEAALGAMRATAKNAQASAARLAPLAGKEYVTPQEFDNARATADQARAALTQAEIDLAYTDIRAPIAGRTGSLAVKAGNLVAPNDAAPLVVINQMQPILVQYSIPQQILPQLQHHQAQGGIRIFITREDGSGDLGEGELIFIDNAVTTDTGTVTLKARLPNTQEQLWPGQYVGVRTQLAVQDDAIVVPLTAVQTGQSGNFVYLVEQGSANIRPVHVDRQVDDLAIIATGLKAGDKVVTRAPRNLRPGVRVVATDNTGKSTAPDVP
jgi:multidrug efflux system membrane fusion protein